MNATASDPPRIDHPRTGHPREGHLTAVPARDPLETFRAPPGAGTLGTWVLVAGLAIAFTWLLFGYAVTRSRSPVPGLAVPVWFWFSTFALLVSSVTLHWSYLSAKMARVTVAHRALLLSTVLGGVFVVLQTPGLVELVQMHRQSAVNAAGVTSGVAAEATSGMTSGVTSGGGAAAYMLILVLVSLHGLHALGGLVRMTVLNRRAHHVTAGQNGAAHLKQMCLFWHFLAIAWVVMFGVILWA
jgi:cytochrome c oxidase subunit III